MKKGFLARTLLPVLGLGIIALYGSQTGAQEEAQRDLARAQTEERRVLRELTDIERELLGIEPEIASLQVQADHLEQQRILHADELAAAQAALDLVKEQVAQRCRALYRINKRGFARIIFSIEDPADLRKTAQYLTSVLRADQSHSKRFLEQVNVKEAALERVETDRAALSALQAELRLSEASLRDTQARRLALLEEIRGRRDLAQSALKEREQAREDLTRRISAASTSSSSRRTSTGTSTGTSKPTRATPPEETGSTGGGGFRSMAGKLPWPTTGSIMRSFGRTQNPRTGASEQNDGIDIGAAFGTPFRAIADGVVQHTGFVDGFGLIVLLQHGSYSSVYAHAGKIQVARGQRVRQGDVLGLVGETGVTDGQGPRLHFEVRYHQTPQDPNNWLKPRRNSP
ncbi:MAG: peptidoglycan DD-metalloendopeptidase family protein [Myxococcota bacterium]|nr:peptidoglycan DD-metalloendopeptidase family protein [Myxococcota bacterium]